MLALGELSLVGDTLNGAGARSTIIDGAGRIACCPRQAAAPSTINGVTIRGGASAQPGGGIDVPGTLNVNNSHIVGNTAPSGGGIYLSGGSGAVLTIVGSTVAGNTASTSSGSGRWRDRHER